MKKFDDNYRTSGFLNIVGIDEAGRGPLAGPVVAASVILPNDYANQLINDSKKLSEEMREYLFTEITNVAVDYNYSIIDNLTIDKINILQSTLLAMKKSLEKLKVDYDIVLIDGNRAFTNPDSISTSCKKIETVIKGDAKSLSIAAASIIAKVVRDREMLKLHYQYPNYGWDRNKGYPTKEHINAIKLYGITPVHRMKFLTRIVPSSIESRQEELNLFE